MSLRDDRIVQAAVSYGLTFGCDPLTVLDRPDRDLPVILSILEIADNRLRERRQ